MKINNEDLKIKIIFPEKEGKIIANANIFIKTKSFGFITIKGFIIWNSSHLHPKFMEPINITAPAIRYGFKYVYTVYFENKNDWYRIEEEIYNEYNKEKNKKNKESEDVNPDEIPI